MRTTALPALLCMLDGCQMGSGANADLRPPGTSDGLHAEPMDQRASLGDLRREAPDASGFPDRLPGIWLIGWAGNLNHYSWVRLGTLVSGEGALQVLQPMGNAAWTGLWSCDAAGTWQLAVEPSTIQLALPGACGASDMVLTFTAFSPPTALFKGEIEEAAITASPQVSLDGHLFPPTQCDAGFTMCTLPL